MNKETIIFEIAGYRHMTAPNICKTCIMQNDCRFCIAAPGSNCDHEIGGNS